MSTEPPTWDERAGARIRRFFSFLGGRPDPVEYKPEPLAEWERAKMEAWDEQERQARARSSEEMHNELRRSPDVGN